MEAGRTATAAGMMPGIVMDHGEKPNTWDGATLESFRGLHNASQGEACGQFAIRHVELSGIRARSIGPRSGAYDIDIRGKLFEVKTASEGANHSFQLDHMRLDAECDCLLALAVSPESIRFGACPKRGAVSGSVGRLVRMAKGQGVTHKVTKRIGDLEPIENLPRWMAANVPASETSRASAKPGRPFATMWTR